MSEKEPAEVFMNRIRAEALRRAAKYILESCPAGHLCPDYRRGVEVSCAMLRAGADELDPPEHEGT